MKQKKKNKMKATTKGKARIRSDSPKEKLDCKSYLVVRFGIRVEEAKSR